MNEEFHSNFISNINACDFDNANNCLMNELGKLLIRSKKDYVDMLNESGIMASESMSDVELIDFFIYNAPRNKKLLLGAALLVNMHNKKMGFDGEDEISDEGVKNSYAVMNSYFCGATYDDDDSEEKSNFIPIGLIARGAKRLINNRQDRKADEAERAKQRMLEQAKREREALAAKKKKERNAWIIGSSVVVGFGLIILVIVKSRK